MSRTTSWEMPRKSDLIGGVDPGRFGKRASLPYFTRMFTKPPAFRRVSGRYLTPNLTKVFARRARALLSTSW